MSHLLKNRVGMLAVFMILNAADDPPAAAENDRVASVPDLKDWLALPSSAISWSCVGWSKHEWVVKTEKGRVVAQHGQELSDRLPFRIVSAGDSRRPDLAGQAHVREVQDGYLLGFDAGEFGGAAWWFSRDGQKRRKLTLRASDSLADYYPENVHGFAELGRDFLAFQGLAHMGADEGRVVKVARDPRGVWQVTPFATLPKCPEAVTTETPTSWLFVATSGVWRLDAQKHLSPVWHPEKGDLSYPSSIVRDPNGVIYVGMRHFVARLTPMNAGAYDVRLLVPPSCDKSSCDCR